MLGYSEPELLSQTFQDVTHPEERGIDVNRDAQMLAGEIRSYQREKRYVTKRGDVIWVLATISLVHGRDGQPLYFLAQVQDITEQKRHTRRLQALAHLSHLISSSLELDEVLREIAQAAATLMDVPVASFWLADEASRTLEARAVSGELTEVAFPRRTMTFEGSAVGWVAQHRERLHVPDVFADARIAGHDWWRTADSAVFSGCRSSPRRRSSPSWC